MTTPTNQPTPPPGMRLLTPEEQRKRLPKGAMFKDDKSGAWMLAKLGFAFSHITYAIPITVPSTGEASLAESCLGPQRPMTEEEQEMLHDFQLGDTTNEIRERGICCFRDCPTKVTHYLGESPDCVYHQMKEADTTNEKGGEQRQELLPIPEAHYSCGGSCREDRSLPADDLAWFPQVKLWLCSECSEDKEEVGDAEITLDKYLKSRK